MNSVVSIILVVAGLGALGGIVNCAITGEFVNPRFDAGIWRPGWLGNVLIGSVAAVVVWGVNGPLASVDVFNFKPSDLHLTVSQLLSSIGVGLGGGNILTQMAQKQAERLAKDTLASTLNKLL
jgi:hypothetical protein